MLCRTADLKARSLAPALFAGGAPLNILWLYFAAPIAGAVLAARLYDIIRSDKDRIPSVPAFDYPESD